MNDVLNDIVWKILSLSEDAMLLLVLLPTSQTFTQPKLVANSSVDNSSSIDNSLVPRLYCVQAE